MISGSEDHFIYLWKTQHEFYKFSSARRDRNDYYEAVKGNELENVANNVYNGFINSYC